MDNKRSHTIHESYDSWISKTVIKLSKYTFQSDLYQENAGSLPTLLAPRPNDAVDMHVSFLQERHAKMQSIM